MQKAIETHPSSQRRPPPSGEQLVVRLVSGGRRPPGPDYLHKVLRMRMKLVEDNNVIGEKVLCNVALYVRLGRCAPFPAMKQTAAADSSTVGLAVSPAVRCSTSVVALQPLRRYVLDSTAHHIAHLPRPPPGPPDSRRETRRVIIDRRWRHLAAVFYSLLSPPYLTAGRSSPK